MSSPYLTSISQFKDLMKQYSSDWFLLGGACLGYTRNRRLISWDKDIDVGILVSDSSMVATILESLPISRTFVYNDVVFEAVLHLESNIDIFFLYPGKDEIFETFFIEALNSVRFYRYDAAIFTEGIFVDSIDGVEVNILKRHVDYCISLYGSQYLVENKSWNSWGDPFNIAYELPIVSKKTLSSVRKIALPDIFSHTNKILKFLTDLVIYKARYSPVSIDLRKGSHGTILFLLLYSKIVKNRVVDNFAHLLLDRTIEYFNKCSVSSTAEIFKLGIFLWYLDRRNLVNVENIDFFFELDKRALALMKNVNLFESPETLILIYQYAELRIAENCFRGLKAAFSNTFRLHISKITEVCSIYIKKMTKGVELSLPEKALFERSMLALSKVFSSQLTSHGVANKGPVKSILFRHRLMTNRLIDANVPLSPTILSYIFSVLGNCQRNRACNLFPTCKYFEKSKPLYTRIVDIYAQMKLAKKFDNIGFDLVIKSINSILFKGNEFNYIPYSRLARFEDLYLENGLPQLGLLLLFIGSSEEVISDSEDLLDLFLS